MSAGSSTIGDNAFGEAVRKAVTAKVDHCPFSDEEKQDFHTFAKDSARRSKEQIDLYIQQHGSLPKKLDGAKKSCKQQMATMARACSNQSGVVKLRWVSSRW